MFSRTLKPAIVSIAILLAMSGWSAAHGAENGESKSSDSSAKTSSDKAKSDRPKADGGQEKSSRNDMQKLVEQFKAQRESLIAAREAALARLKDATEEERKELLAKMQAEEKRILEAQRARARQIRDEMRKLRPAATPPGQK